MAKTYSQLTAQIEALRQKAEAAKKKEAAGVIGRIKEAIAFYDLTAEDLGFGVKVSKAAAVPVAVAKTKPKTKAKGKAKAKSKPAKKSSAALKYSDGAGNNWSGMGPKPGWLQKALAAGKTLEDFTATVADSPAPGASGPDKTPSPKPPQTKAAKKSVPPVVKYKDDAGHTWSGRGPQPGWLKAALAAGKTVQDFAA
jgi:DNA-binding protein H-NS